MQSSLLRQSAEAAGAFELDSILGRRKAFSVVAGRCSAADAAGPSRANIGMMRPCIPLVSALLAARAFAQPAPLSGFSDGGAFLLYLNEERAGRIVFSWQPDGHFESSFVRTPGGDAPRSTLSLTPDAEGRWTQAIFEDGHGKTTIQRKGAGDLTVASRDRNGQGTLPPDMLVYEEIAPALISQALRRYDAAEGGRQTFGVLEVSKVEGGALTLERQDVSERTVGGRKLKLARWVYARPGSELHVLAGEDGRVYLVSGIPSYAGAGVSEPHAVYVREGYEGLLPPPDPDPLISRPKYEVRVETVQVPMRDGVKLATDLYLPVGAPPAPLILMRTPYGKGGGQLRARFFARRGYAFAIQDVRGRYASEGQWEALVNEPRDGYDAIEWLARQPWCDGKVGMLGASYLGWVQWMAAAEHPPHLVTIVPNVSPPDPFHNLPYDRGAVPLLILAPWFTLVETNAKDPDEANAGRDWPELLKRLPVIDLDKAILGRESLTWRHWMGHPTADDYWRGVMFLDKLKDVRLPVFHESGWFDGDGIGTKLNYLAMAAYGRAPQKLTIGPWGHSDTAMRTYGDRDFGSTAVIDVQRDYLRWFDYWLKGIDNGILKEPLVSLFVMGSNRWLHGPKYPLPETRFEKLYLESGGRLSFTPPAGEQPADTYVYDPGDPTPDPGNAGPAERDSFVAARKDILVYTSAPFEKPYTIAGPMSAVLYAASSARDTDWFVHLLEVDAGGKCSLLWSNGAGQVRARYRNSVTKTGLIEPGKVYRYPIDLWHTGITIAAGHRLRVEVASANFPTFGRNLNTGGNNETETRFVQAKQAIYHDARRASYILLPRIPR